MLWYLSFPAAILAGICLGAVAAARGDSGTLFSAAAESLSSATLCFDSFKKALGQSVLAVTLLCVFGTTVLGALPASCLLCFRGYAVGKTVGALVGNYGLRGFFAALCGVFPHNLFYIPCLCLLSIHGTRFSRRLLSRQVQGKRQLTSYFLASLFLSIPMFFGCALEGYVSAPLLRWILGGCL